MGNRVSAATFLATVRTVLNCQRQNEGFSLFNGANANGRMRVSASVPKTVRSIVLVETRLIASLQGVSVEQMANIAILGHTVFDRPASELCAVVQACFAQHVADMAFDGALTHI